MEAVELEPAVIEFARKHFGYKGHAVAAEGLEYLKKNEKTTYDVVLMDAFEGMIAPECLRARSTWSASN